MRLYLVAAVAFVVPCGAVLAEEQDTYLLTMPFDYGDQSASDRCKQAAEIGGAACDLVTLGPDGGAMTVINDIGSRDALLDRWGSEISIPDVAPDGDVGTGPGVDVVVNPCWRMNCGPEAICRWDSSQPWLAAQCVNISNDTIIGPKPTWPSVPMGRLISLMALELKDGAASAPEEQPDSADRPNGREFIPDCGVQLPRGKTCMGTHIVDEQGRIWMIP